MAAELAKDKGRKQKVSSITFDFETKNHWQDYETLSKEIKNLTKGGEISVLVNNAEQLDPKGIKFHKLTDQQVLNTLSVNTFPMVFLTRFLGPTMKERKQKSAIINVTNLNFPLVNAPIYSSARRFEDVFSQTLGYEN